MAALVFGLDLGTTSVAAVAVRTDGRVVATKSTEHGAEIAGEHEWESLQDPDRIYETACSLLGELESEVGTPAGLGICCQMHGGVYVDARGRAVSPLYTWLDGRGDRPSNHGQPPGESYAARLSRLTGRRLSTGYALVTHSVLQDRGHVPAGARSLTTIGAYVAMRLSGNTRPAAEPSLAHSMGAYDLARDGWDPAALEAAALPRDFLPRLVDSGTVLGHVGRHFGSTERKIEGTGAADTSPAPIPVTVAIGDNPSGFLGTVGKPETTAVVSLGTSGQVTVLLSESDWGEDLEVRPFPGKRHIAVGASLTGGKSYALLRDFYRSVCKAAGAGTELGYEQMNELAEAAYRRLKNNAEATGTEATANVTGTEATANVTGTEATTVRRLEEDLRPARGPLRDARFPLVDTRFQGSRADPAVRARITNLGPDNFDVGMIALGVLGGEVAELHRFFAAFPESARNRIRRIAVTGNAIRRNPLLERLISEYFGHPVVVRRHEEEAAVGAALSGGVGIGIWGGFLEAASLVEELA